MQYRTLDQYAEEIMRARSMPHKLAELQIEIAAKYASLSEIAKGIKIQKAIFWDKKFEKEKPLSDTALDAMWIQTEDGKDELKMKLELNALDRLTKAIQTAIVVNSVESRMDR